MDQVLVRSAAVRILFVVIAALAALAVLAALAGSAHAMPEPPPDVRVAGALFTPTRTTDGIDWTAQWVLTPDGAADLDGGATRIVRFAIPLADDDSIEPMAASFRWSSAGA